MYLQIKEKCNWETAVIKLERFILEIGNDFAFLARQKRITIDEKDYYEVE